MLNLSAGAATRGRPRRLQLLRSEWLSGCVRCISSLAARPRVERTVSVYVACIQCSSNPRAGRNRIVSYRGTQQAVTDLDLGGALDGLFEGACHLDALGAGGGRKTQSGQAVRNSGGRGAAAGRRKGTEISRLRDCRAVEQAGLRWAATEGRELQAVLLSDAAAAGGPAKMTMTMTMGRPVGIHGRPSTTKGAE